ncbi:hypothetical protein BDF14DRAFT_1806703 [Spinellus fusiger]|nr:hypothetical protein BDF14DRAFT_1806703 [Spinellus fusiger]
MGCLVWAAAVGQWICLPRISGSTLSGGFRAGADDGIVCGVLLLPMVAVAQLLHALSTADTPSIQFFQGYVELLVLMSLLFVLCVYVSSWWRVRIAPWKQGGLVVLWGGISTVLVIGIHRGAMGMPVLHASSLLRLLLAVHAFQGALYVGLVALQRSFTLGEMGILSQTLGVLVYSALTMLWGTAYLSPDTSHVNSTIFQISVLIHALVLGMLVVGGMGLPLLRYSRRIAQTSYWRSRRVEDWQSLSRHKVVVAVLFYAATAVVVVGWVAPLCQRMTGQHPILWTLAFVFTSPARLVLFLYWGVLVGVTVVVWVHVLDVGLDAPTGKSSRRVLTSTLNKKRKLFHALAVMMFVPGVLLQPYFLELAFGVALAAFIYLEYLRYFAVWPYSKRLHLFLSEFIDERDLGPVILSHIYLLLGCAGPVWLRSSNLLATFSGILSLGLGDAAASLVGKYCGRWSWPGTQKTVEGTLAFVVIVCIGSWCIISMANTMHIEDTTHFGVMMDSSQWIAYVFIVVLTGLLEAFSTQNDNIVIPLYMYALISSSQTL